MILTAVILSGCVGVVVAVVLYFVLRSKKVEVLDDTENFY
jgi:uncharacterized MnhB-related membrane protein